MVTNYSRGYAFELRVKKYYEAMGFFVIRSSGSHGLVDLACFQLSYNRPPLFVQCKRGGVISKSDKQALYKLALSASAYAVVASLNTKGKLILELIEGD